MTPATLLERYAAVRPHLTEAERAEVDRLLQVRPRWRPLPGPQTDAYHCQADILFYGGAGGGGKTDLLLGLARHEHRRSIIFRRVFPELRAIIDRSAEIYAGGRGTYNEARYRWRFMDGRTVRFGSMQFEKDAQSWAGQPHDLYAFDELPEFTESQFRFVTGWNRTTHRGQRCRVVGTGNPPVDAEGEWVLRFWAPWLDETYPNPAKPGELRYFTTVAGKDVEQPNGEPVLIKGEWVKPLSRTFIPARVEDNPYLVASGYVAKLQALPEPLRSKLLYGDFRAGREDDAYQLIPSEWVRLAQERWKVRPKPTTPMSALGADVARGGKDRTVLTPRHDNWFGEQVVEPGKATPDGPAVATLCVQHRRDDAVVNIDIIGVGSSPYDVLRGTIGAKAVAMNGAEGTEARDKSGKLGFVNRRAEWWWRLREGLDPTSEQDLALPPDPELRSDLCAPRWKLTARGIQVEAKEDVIARIGRSPDKGDSLVYAHAIVTPAGQGWLDVAKARAVAQAGAAEKQAQEPAKSAQAWITVGH